MLNKDEFLITLIQVFDNKIVQFMHSKEVHHYVIY